MHNDDENKKDEIQKYIQLQLNNHTSHENPYAIITVGVSGSGKTSNIPRYLTDFNENEKDYVLLDPDIVLDKFFTNYADNINEIHSINDELFKKAVENRYNIVFNGTGKDFGWTKQHVVDFLKNNQYRVFICIQLIELEKAFQRIQTREKQQQQTKQKISIHTLHKIYSLLQKSILRYLNLSCSQLNGILVYDNNKDNENTLIFKKNCSNNQSIECQISNCNEPIYDKICQLCFNTKTKSSIQKSNKKRKRSSVGGKKKTKKIPYKTKTTK